MRPSLGARDTGAPSVIPRGYERMQMISGARPRQPRSLTRDEQRAGATRGDLWPVFLPPADAPPLPPRDSHPLEELTELLDFL